ncbi:MAG: MATE family efflux transporter [Pseudomonadota bacterium]
MTELSSAAPMPWRGHIRASVTLGLPLIGSHIAQTLTHITDVVMLGWYSVDALAAVVLAAQVFFVVFLVGSGFAFAVMPLAASALGAGDDDKARRSVRMGSWACMAYALVMAIPLWFTESILLALGQQPHLAAIAGDYMQIAMWGLFPALLIMVLKSWFGALEQAGIVLWATIMAALFNALFNFALIFGNFGSPELGVKGAAIASVLTVVLDYLFLAGWVMWRRDLRQAKLFARMYRIDWPVLKDVFRLGTPISFTLLAETGLFSAATFMVGSLGSTATLAAHGIVLQIISISFMIPLGISNVATIRAGRAAGRSDALGLYRGAQVVLWWAAAASVLAMTVFITVPDVLIALFLDPSEAQRTEIIQIGATLLLFAAAFQLVDALQIVAMGLLRGIHDTAMPMVFSVFGFWVLAIPFGYTFAFHLGYGAPGVWAGLVVGFTFAAAMMLMRFHTLRPMAISAPA